MHYILCKHWPEPVTWYPRGADVRQASGNVNIGLFPESWNISTIVKCKYSCWIVFRLHGIIPFACNLCCIHINNKCNQKTIQCLIIYIFIWSNYELTLISYHMTLFAYGNHFYITYMFNSLYLIPVVSHPCDKHAFITHPCDTRFNHRNYFSLLRFVSLNVIFNSICKCSK